MRWVARQRSRFTRSCCPERDGAGWFRSVAPAAPPSTAIEQRRVGCELLAGHDFPEAVELRPVRLAEPGLDLLRQRYPASGGLDVPGVAAPLLEGDGALVRGA